ncbi:MAG: hypothetical protein HYR85_19930 [Planctomycetes bacterium]|nr:hypothetical protein [Planctomycetota bacterium]MBI3844499.1 hypothetical protein [Planctomycetota bacterium]
MSVSSSGEQADGPNLEPVISRDGRFVAFSSLADNLVSDDANGVRDVFLHDRMAAGTIRASVNSAGIEADGDSSAPSISAGGRFVVFESIATNLIANDANGKADIFVRDLAPCGDGTVHDLSGTAVAVLGVNGNTGVVTLGRGQSVDFTLDVTPTGPNPARYIVWIWPVLPTNQMDLRAMGQSLGCTVNPTPLARGARPQPVACLRGTGVPAPACGTAHSMHAPASAPWVVRRTQGFANPVVFTLQGVIEDAGSASSTGFSVTNAVEVVIE